MKKILGMVLGLLLFVPLAFAGNEVITPQVTGMAPTDTKIVDVCVTAPITLSYGSDQFPLPSSSKPITIQSLDIPKVGSGHEILKYIYSSVSVSAYPEIVVVDEP